MMIKKIIKQIFFIVLFCVLFIAPGLAGTAQYTYDNLNRLVQVQFDGGTTIQYSYDAAGNRLVKRVTVFQASAPITGRGSGVLAESYLSQISPFSTWWGAIWGTPGESTATPVVSSIK